MDRIWYLIKKTPLYFWLILVVGQSFIEILPLPVVKNKIIDLVVVAILSVLISNQLLQANQFSAFAYGWNWALFYIVVFLIFRFIWSLLSIPPRIFFEQKRLVDKSNWSDVIIRKKEFKSKRGLFGCAIEFVNNKPFDLWIFVQIPYIECDGEVDEEDERLTQDHMQGRSRKLAWNPVGSQNEPLELWVAENGGKQRCNLLNVVRTSEGIKNSVSYYEPPKDVRRLVVEHRLFFDQYIRGELIIFASLGSMFPDWLERERYFNFEVSVQGNRRPRIEFAEGRLESRMKMGKVEDTNNVADVAS